RAFEKGLATSARPVLVRFNGEEGLVHVIVRPAGGESGRRRALVLFAEVDAAEGAGGTEGSPIVNQLEEELQQAKEQLRRTAEEYEAQREEMKASNEELQSINEEYRSATEELETSKEELQSTNEELQTVNHELKVKIDEISRAHADLQNLLDATDIATVFLDRALRIQRYTQNTAALFHIRPADVGRPLAELRPRLDYEHLTDDARRSFEQLELVEREVRGEDGRWFLARLRPYRTTDDQIEGVLLTFVDVTAQKRAEVRAEAEAAFASHIVDTIRESLLVLDTDLRVLKANESFYETFQVSPDETEGHLIYELGDGQWDLPELRTLIERILPENEAFNDYEVAHDFEHIGRRTMLLNARRLDNQQRILLAIEDVTDRGHHPDQMEEAVRVRTRQARQLASALVMAEQRERRRISAILHDHLQQFLFGIQLHVSTLVGAVPEALRERASSVNHLLGEALDVTRTLTVELSPPVLKGEGLDAAFAWLASQVEATYGLEVEVELSGPVRVPDEDMRVLLFQLVRELLFNVVKHAETERARVVVHEADDRLHITVADEGRGFDVEEVLSQPVTEAHVGLIRMRERLDLFGGELVLDSEPGAGTRASIHVPLNSSPSP
ncbi:MAG: PAS domain-containing protein, partial [Rhodothermales bacterium]|nr:PAS domain-containing protein [Rhodothermales bacterium]